jgi:arsenate reductase (glutaredoxin)
MPEVIIYHNPRCRMSRKALELIQHKRIKPKIIEYLKTPPTVKELDAILKKLKMEPRDIIRTKEIEYKKLKLDNPGLTRLTLIEAMANHPILIQRPIVLSGGKAALGRPPERVETIL